MSTLLERSPILKLLIEKANYLEYTVKGVPDYYC